MDYDSKLSVYRAQVENVKSLHKAMRQVHRSINAGLRDNDQTAVEAFTKIYALLFCAWAEANFSKVIHTPHGFELDEIDQINRAKMKGVSDAWKKCADLGLRHLDSKRGSFQPNAKQKLNVAIDNYVLDPSVLRNRLGRVDSF
jgi:hypothetical protein